MKTIESLAATLSITDANLANHVYELVCGLSDDEFNALADLSLNPDGTSLSVYAAWCIYPDFADSSTLGEFDNLEAAQCLMQEIYDAVE